MKEEDAIKKWCPLVRMGNQNGGGFNRDIQTPDAAYYKCIASECMMWEPELFDSGIPGQPAVSETCGDCRLKQ